MENQSLRGILVAAWILGLAAQPATAQTNAEVNAGIQFNFSTPGARSLGLGGAFLGLADDATAAYANPAGLTALSAPEVSLEGRTWSFSHVFTDRGRRTGTLTKRGVDTEEGLRNGTAEDAVTGVSFLSYVVPRRRWAAAFYRHELANFEASFTTQGAFSNDTNRALPSRNTLQLKIVNLGLAVAYRVNDDLSAGLGLSYYDFMLTSQSLRYSAALPIERTDPGGFSGPPLYSIDNLNDIQIQKGNTSDVAVNVGFTWQAAEAWQIGGVYRQGPVFGLQAITEVPSGSEQTRREGRFTTPDVIGMGVAFQPTEVSTVTLDYVWIEYSDLTDRFTDIFPGEASGQELAFFQVEDAGELHLGFEYFFSLPKALLAARFGTWYDPAHRIHYEGQVAHFLTLFQPGEDQIHYSAGVGFVGSSFQVDAAFDFSERVKTASLSTVVRF